MKSRHVLAVAAALLVFTTALAQTPAPEAQPAAAPESAAAAAAAPAAPAEKLSYTDDYRITVNHDATGDGEIAFRLVTQKEGTTHDIKVAIKKDTSENNVARAIKDVFKAQLKKGYSVEGEDGESVIIEGHGGKKYSLVLVSNTVPGVAVSIHHD
jgi:hypothetical protein